jgi:hypothetical protein
MGAARVESSCRKISKSLVKWGEADKGKSASSKNNMSRDNDIVGGEIKTPLTFVTSGVSEENTSDGCGCQFMIAYGREVGIVGTTKHEQVLI